MRGAYGEWGRVRSYTIRPVSAGFRRTQPHQQLGDVCDWHTAPVPEPLCCNMEHLRAEILTCPRVDRLHRVVCTVTLLGSSRKRMVGNVRAPGSCTPYLQQTNMRHRGLEFLKGGDYKLEFFLYLDLKCARLCGVVDSTAIFLLTNFEF